MPIRAVLVYRRHNTGGCRVSPIQGNYRFVQIANIVITSNVATSFIYIVGSEDRFDQIKQLHTLACMLTAITTLIYFVNHYTMHIHAHPPSPHECIETQLCLPIKLAENSYGPVPYYSVRMRTVQ